MLHDDERLISVKLCYGGPAKFAEGGLAAAGQAVADAGRFGDEMVVHVNRREFDELRHKWGDPHVNPDTGLPEFWGLKDLWHSVKDYVVPVGAAAAGAFLPGIGSAVGSALPGVAGLLGSTGTQALATGLLGAGAGALLGGGKGALYGGLGGVLGSYGGDLLMNGGSSALGSLLGGGDSLAAASAENAGLDLGGASGGSGAAGSLLSNLGGGNSKLGSAVLTAALDLAGNAMDQGAAPGEKANKKAWKQAQAQFNQPLPVYENPRRRSNYTGVPDATTQGEQTYFDNNHFASGGKVEDRLPNADDPYYTDGPYNPDFAKSDSGMDPISWLGYLLGAQKQYPEVADGKSDREHHASGGHVGYVQNHTGDDGRSDKIKALLSPNEYVVDAETVSLLGNGSPEAGAAQLDQLRANIRKHKGSALAHGAISPDALPADQYLRS
jgi:hypothetical protein